MSTSVSHLRAIGFALAAFTFWVMGDSSMKMASEANLPPYETVAFLGFFGVLFMVLKATPSKGLKALWPQHPQKQLARAMLSLGVNLCNAIALKHIPLTLFYVTAFTAPIVISLLAALILKEHLSPLRIMAVLAGFAGVIIAIDPFTNAGHGDWIGYVAALTGVLFFAASTVWLRVMTQKESADSLAFFTCFVEMVIGITLLLFHAEPLTLKLVIVLTVMGFFCILGNLFNYKALKHTTAATVSQFHYTQIIAGALIGYVVWHEIPTLHLLIGVLVITVAGLTVVAQKPKPPHEPPELMPTPV